MSQNYEESVRLFRLSASAGDMNACCNLAWELLNSNGVEKSEKNEKDAHGLYMKAAVKGNKSAQFMIGWMYLKGWGVPVNEEEASRWLSLSGTFVVFCFLSL